MSFTWNKQRVLLTGGSGFLGSNMRRVLTCEVVAPTHAEYDLTRQRDVWSMFQKYRPTVVVHMAGLVGGIGANTEKPAEFFYKNALMGILLMHEAHNAGVGKFVGVAAGCGYPEAAPIPIKEDSLWDGPPQWWSAPYSLAKRNLVTQARAMNSQYGFKSVIAMPGNLYGPEDNFNLEEGHVVPALVRKFVEAKMFEQDTVSVWGSGKATRDFVYVEDVCLGLLRVAEAFDDAELVNLSSGVESSVAEVVDLLAKITGFKGRVVWDKTKPDGQLRRCFDVSRASSVGWEAKVGLEEGLEKTVEWFRANYARARK